MAMYIVRADGPQEPEPGAFKGIVISVEPDKPQYTLQEGLPVTVSIKNISDDTIELVWYNSYAQYRMALFDERGVPVAKLKRVIEQENRPPNKMIEYISVMSEELAPGQVTRAIFDLSDWFKIEKGGVYQLVVMRQVGDALWEEGDDWKKGCAISNLIKVVIAEP